MRSRDKPLTAYGVPEESISELYAQCTDDRYTADLLDAIKRTVPPGLQGAVFMGLHNNMGFLSVQKRIPVYCERKTFYGYKRRAAAEFYFIQKERKMNG